MAFELHDDQPNGAGAIPGPERSPSRLAKGTPEGPRRRPLRALAAILLLPVLAGCISIDGPAWPLWQDETLPGDVERKDRLYPLVREERVDDVFVALLAPFGRVERQGDEEAVHVAYPLFTYREGPGKRDVFLRPFFWSHDRAVPGGVDRDWAFAPLLFGGSDPEEGDYLLLFPFWGNLKGLLGEEEIRFRLFPLYMDTRDRGYRSTHLVWPLIAWGDGDGRTFRRVLPFYVRDDVEGKRRYRSVLWPLIHWGEEALDTGNPIRSTAVLPFYGQRDSERAWSRTYLWPLFGFAGDANGLTRVEAPWPILRWSKEPGRESFHLWPLFGGETIGKSRSSYLLWPIVWSWQTPRPDGRTESFRIAPLLLKRRAYDIDGFEVTATDQLWPLFRNVRRQDGTVRFRMLDPIPFHGLDEVRDGYGWIWSLVDHRRDLDGRSSTDLLWGAVQLRRGPGRNYAGVPLLIEYDRRHERRRFQLLKGLAGLETTAEGTAIRLLWFVRLSL